MPRSRFTSSPTTAALGSWPIAEICRLHDSISVSTCKLFVSLAWQERVVTHLLEQALSRTVGLGEIVGGPGLAYIA